MAASRWKDVFEATANGDEIAVRHYVEEQGIPVTSTNDEQQTLALIAAENMHLKVLRYVLQKEPSLLTRTDIYGNTVLYHAVEQGFLPMVRYLVDELQSNIYTIISPPLGNNAIHVAAEEGHLDLLKYFVEDKKADVNTRNESGEPPLFLAAAKSHMPVIVYLVEKANATVTLTDGYNNTILGVIAETGDLRVPRYLLDTRKIALDVNQGNEVGRTAVYSASRYNHLALLKYLVEEKKANVNICDDYGRSPLYSAADKGNLRIVKYLIKHGADPQIKDTFGRTAKDGSKSDEVTNYLEEVMKNAPLRTRRSVPPLPNFVGRIAEDTLSRNPVLMASTRDHGPINKENLSHVDCYLLFAIACVGHAKRFRHKGLSSPPEMIGNMIEPLALEAAQTVRNPEYTI